MLDRYTPPLLIKSTPSGVGEFVGYAATFNGPVDAYGDVILPGAFAETLEEHAKAGTKPLLLWIHNQREPIGVWTDLKETADGLFAKGKLSLGTDRGRGAHSLMQDGALSLSIGFRPKPGGRKVNDYGGADLSAIDLLEVSVVPLPANPAAKILDVKAAALRSPIEFQSALREHLGLSDREAKRAAAGGWRSLTRSGERTYDEAELVAELRRINSTLKLR